MAGVDLADPDSAARPVPGDAGHRSLSNIGCGARNWKCRPAEMSAMVTARMRYSEDALQRGCVTARMRYSEDAGERFTWQTAARQASSLSDLQRKRRFRREEPETAVRSLADGVPEVHNPTGSSVVFAALKSKSSVGVGTPGFEPGTSAPPERRANRAAPCPESVSPRSDQPLWKTPCNKRSLCSEVSGSLVCGPLGWRRRASRLRKGL